MAVKASHGPIPSDRGSVQDVAARPNSTHQQQALLLMHRLGRAAENAGLSRTSDVAGRTSESALGAADRVARVPSASSEPHTPTKPTKRKASASPKHPHTPPSADLYHGVFGANFAALESPSRKSRDDNLFRIVRHPMSPPEPHARVQPRMPASRTFTRGNASDWLNRIASSPQLGSPQRAGATTDLHNYPPPEVLRYERQAACLQSPVKRPRIHAAFHEPPAFCFPAHGASGSSPQLRLPNGHVASSLAQDLGLCEGSPHVRHRGPVHSHARNASLSSLSDARHETGLVPIPNTPDTLRTAHDTRPWHSRNWSMDSVPLRPLHAPPRRRLAPPPQSLPAPRHAYLDNSALSSRSWGRETISRAHRRSVSHSMVETMTPVPVSRDRSGLITTPPGALTSPVYPDTPKTMGCHFPSGEFLNTSPTPQPRQRAPKGARPQRATLAAKPGHARVQSDDLRS